MNSNTYGFVESCNNKTIKNRPINPIPTKSKTNNVESLFCIGLFSADNAKSTEPRIMQTIPIHSTGFSFSLKKKKAKRKMKTIPRVTKGFTTDNSYDFRANK